MCGVFQRRQSLAQSEQQFLEQPQKEYVETEYMQQNDNLCFHKQSSLIDVKSEAGALSRGEPQDIITVYGYHK